METHRSGGGRGKHHGEGQSDGDCGSEAGEHIG